MKSDTKASMIIDVCVGLSRLRVGLTETLKYCRSETTFSVCTCLNSYD